MKIKNRQQLLIAVAVGVAALFAADKIILTPITNLWKVRAKEVAEIQKDVLRGNSLISRERSLRARWEDMSLMSLSNNSSAAEQQVLHAFDRWAQDSRITISSIGPQWKHDNDLYTTLQCRIEGSGNLKSVTEFLYSLGKERLALKLESLEISARDTEGQQFSLGLQVSGLVLPTQLQKP